MSDSIPYRFDKTHDILDLRQKYEGKIEPGETTEDYVTIAGRLMLSRPQGKIFFGNLTDWTGTVQLFAQENSLVNFRDLTKMSLGDWIGASGYMMRTKKGELSVKLNSFVPLAFTKHGFGDKYKGITDTDLRYRHREVDLWANESTLKVFLARSKVISYIRGYLQDKGFVEVETPILNKIAGGATAKPFVTYHNSLGTDFYLRIAPELYLKRLVVGGFEKVFEIGRVFRNEGLSTRHNPEFTLLELYQAYVDYTDLMVLCENLIYELALMLNGTSEVAVGNKLIDLKPPFRRATMEELIFESINERVNVHIPLNVLHEIAKKHNVTYDESWKSGKLVLEIYEKTTESDLEGPVFVLDYPKEVSPLARTHRDDELLVERFECIIAGRELSNAFSELNDPKDQLERMTDQARQKKQGDSEAMDVDYDYVRALEHGLPPTGGLGIGIDRLVMLLTGATAIRDVILFPTLKPVEAEFDGDSEN